MIKPNQKPVDILHIADLLTTAARLAGVLDKILNDRVTDGVDQTTLLLLGEGHGRRGWIKTIPGEGWEILLRLYGPLEPYFDGT